MISALAAVTLLSFTNLALAKDLGDFQLEEEQSNLLLADRYKILNDDYLWIRHSTESSDENSSYDTALVEKQGGKNPLAQRRAGSRADGMYQPQRGNHNSNTHGPHHEHWSEENIHSRDDHVIT